MSQQDEARQRFGAVDPDGGSRRHGRPRWKRVLLHDPACGFVHAPDEFSIAADNNIEVACRNI